MNYVIEGIYNLIESTVIMFFIAMYFKPKPIISRVFDFIISIAIIFILEMIIGLLSTHWLLTLVIVSLSTYGIVSFFYKGNISERIIIAFISIFLLALSDVCAFTLISKFLGIDYHELVIQSNFSRFLAVMSSKTLYLITVSLIISFKKRYDLFLSKSELILMLITLALSGVQVSLIRNVIYHSQNYYNTFLIILLCTVSINIIIYYTMVYIGKKNIDKRQYSLMIKQLELQAESIKNFESKYDETVKIRHDFKNYISCALDMAEKNDRDELIKFLEDLSEEKINSITSYVATKRRVIGAILNNKLSKAKNLNIDMQLYLLSEAENISDMDIGIILANLLDNALEACEKNSGHSEITLKTWSEAGYYFIEVSNTVENNVLLDNPKLKTSKKNSELHGVGLRSVRDIVEKYEGMIGFDQNGKIFKVLVSLAKEL